MTRENAPRLAFFALLAFFMTACTNVTRHKLYSEEKPDNSISIVFIKKNVIVSNIDGIPCPMVSDYWFLSISVEKHPPNSVE